MTLRGALLVAGTTSDAGKSVLTAGLCQALARRGVRVAPFKAQNMSLNSYVTVGGAEIGRAQAMQAAAAGIEPDARMNPVLLKPGSDTRSHVIVLGQPAGEASATGYRQHADRLRGVALDSLASLRTEYDVVICEGAGSPAEINLRDTDIANMGLARRQWRRGPDDPRHGRARWRCSTRSTRAYAETVNATLPALLALLAVLVGGKPPAGLAMLAAITLTAMLAALLAAGARMAAAVTAIPLGSRVAALREKSWRAAFLPQLDPDAPGRARPRAPSAAPAAA
jgi:hypothetical protein